MSAPAAFVGTGLRYGTLATFSTAVDLGIVVAVGPIAGGHGCPRRACPPVAVQTAVSR